MLVEAFFIFIDMKYRVYCKEMSGYIKSFTELPNLDNEECYEHIESCENIREAKIFDSEATFKAKDELWMYHHAEQVVFEVDMIIYENIFDLTIPTVLVDIL